MFHTPLKSVDRKLQRNHLKQIHHASDGPELKGATNKREGMRARLDCIYKLKIVALLSVYRDSAKFAIDAVNFWYQLATPRASGRGKVICDGDSVGFEGRWAV